MAQYGLNINNPGNLRPFKNNFYLGQTDLRPNGEAVFSSMLYGLRALAMDLNIKIDKDHLTNIQQIANIYAPASDGNNPIEYANTVAKVSGIGKYDYLVSDNETVARLMRGIIVAENGYADSAKISDTDINDGIMLYNGVEVAKKSGSIFVLITLGFAGYYLYKKHSH
jgi:hypothetical protein